MCLDANPTDKPIIELGLSQIKIEEELVIVFSVLHINSVFHKSIDATLHRYGQTITSLISNQINGLCDLEIHADFGNQTYASVTIWPNNRNIIPLNEFIGVEYKLIFYY